MPQVGKLLPFAFARLGGSTGLRLAACEASNEGLVRPDYAGPETALL
jgi:hypothetical protein